MFATGARAVTYSNPAALSLVDLGTGATSGLQSGSTLAGTGSESFAFSSNGRLSSGVYALTTVNVAMSPFGDSSMENYIGAEPGGSVTIVFSTPQTSFGLLWGSVDPYNSLTFMGDGTVVTGADVGSALGFPANGTLNENVVISGLAAFTQVLVQSGAASFELVPGTPIPEPVSLSVFGTGVVGVGLMRRRQRGRTAD